MVTINNLEKEVDMFERHIEILKTIQKNEPVGIIILSKITKYPQHTIRYSLRMLAQDGLINPSSKGAITTDSFLEGISTIKSRVYDLNQKISKLLEKI